MSSNWKPRAYLYYSEGIPDPFPDPFYNQEEVNEKGEEYQYYLAFIIQRYVEQHPASRLSDSPPIAPFCSISSSASQNDTSTSNANIFEANSTSISPSNGDVPSLALSFPRLDTSDWNTIAFEMNALYENNILPLMYKEKSGFSGGSMRHWMQGYEAKDIRTAMKEWIPQYTTILQALSDLNSGKVLDGDMDKEVRELKEQIDQLVEMKRKVLAWVEVLEQINGNNIAMIGELGGIIPFKGAYSDRSKALEDIRRTMLRDEDREQMGWGCVKAGQMEGGRFLFFLTTLEITLKREGRNLEERGIQSLRHTEDNAHLVDMP